MRLAVVQERAVERLEREHDELQVSDDALEVLGLLAVSLGDQDLVLGEEAAVGEYLLHLLAIAVAQDEDAALVHDLMLVLEDREVVAVRVDVRILPAVQQKRNVVVDAPDGVGLVNDVNQGVTSR